MSDAVRGLVVGHGDMPAGLVDAVRQITGIGEEALIAVSNRGLSPDALSERIRAQLSGSTIVFTDLQSGSCGIAARRTCAQALGVYVITGVNLPLLLDFVTHRELPLDQLLDRLVPHGRDGIQLITPPAADGHRSATHR
jgi:mannose/fructose-specific phosphotransferase system component IIA